MESRFNKYEEDNQEVSSQIANINSYIDWNFKNGLDIIEKEIKALDKLINDGHDNSMFPKKKKELIALGKLIETIHATYHFNREN